MAPIPQDILVGASGGAVAGYAAGRVTKMAVQVLKWLVAIFIGIQVSLDQLGVITIHYERASEVMNNAIGISGTQELFTELSTIILSWVPTAGGFGAGFYAGYKKMLF